MEHVQSSAAHGGSNPSGKQLLQLGIIYSSGRSGSPDLIAAHKWFNLAAMQGNKEAIRHRHEIAAEMSVSQIAAAQREARKWRAAH